MTSIKYKIGLWWKFTAAACATAALIAATPAFADEPGAGDRTVKSDRLALADPVAAIPPPTRNPASVQNRIDEINAPKKPVINPERYGDPLAGWYDFKDRLNTELGLRFGLSYAPMVLNASPNVSGSPAAGGVFNFDMSWNLYGRGTDHPGYLLFRVQDRHSYTDVSPTALFLNGGSLWPATIPYAPFNLSVLELAWQQHFVDDRFVVKIGKMLPFAVHDYFRYKSPFDGFSDATLTLNPTIAWVPSALGAAAFVRPADDFYVIAGLYDANGQPQKAGFDTFFNTREYLTLLDVGWDPGYLKKNNAVYIGNLKVSDIHATIWHRDGLSASNTPSGWGITLFAEGEIGRYVPFIRIGFSDGNNNGPAMLNRMVAGGVGIRGLFGYENDVLGVGVGWGSREVGKIDTDLDGVPDLNVGEIHQVSTEVFYKMQLTRELALTPLAQFVFNPALDPSRDYTAFVGLRAKLAL